VADARRLKGGSFVYKLRWHDIYTHAPYVYLNELTKESVINVGRLLID